MRWDWRISDGSHELLFFSVDDDVVLIIMKMAINFRPHRSIIVWTSTSDIVDVISVELIALYYRQMETWDSKQRKKVSISSETCTAELPINYITPETHSPLIFILCFVVDFPSHLIELFTNCMIEQLKEKTSIANGKFGFSFAGVENCMTWIRDCIISLPFFC